MWKCPVCEHSSIGKVGVDQYYCWDCCIEFTMSADSTVIYNVEVDGTLSPINDSQDDNITLEAQKE